MRHVVKYLLFLAILMSGFYMARKFRAPDGVDADALVPPEVGAEHPAFVHGDVETTPARTQLPVAALVDIDKSPARGMVDSGRDGNSFSTDELEIDAEQRTVRRQPTVKSPSKPFIKNSSKSKRNRRDDGFAARERDAERADQRSADQPVDEVRDRGSRPAYDPSYDDPLPDFAEQYQPWLDPLDESEDSEPSSANVSHGEEPLEHTAAADRPAAELSGPRRHEIVAGDTLELLAQRYFGDRDRQLEIYEANRDVLVHPRLLPIGVEISIPASMETAMADVANEGEDGGHANDPWGEAVDEQPVDEAASPVDPEAEADDHGQIDDSADSSPAAEQPSNGAEEAHEATPAEEDATDSDMTDYWSWRSAR